MVLSINKLLIVKVFCFVTVAFAALSLCFKIADFKNVSEAVTWSNRCLRDNFDWGEDLKMKKWDLYVSPDFFVRLKKTYTSGKQEYYSFPIKHFSAINYAGTSAQGVLELITDDDSIIEQTYNDPAGDEDNMIQSMKISLRNMEPERLDSLRMAFTFLKNAK